jgi:hypothetical protein
LRSPLLPSSPLRRSLLLLPLELSLLLLLLLLLLLSLLELLLLGLLLELLLLELLLLELLLPGLLLLLRLLLSSLLRLLLLRLLSSLRSLSDSRRCARAAVDGDKAVTQSSSRQGATDAAVSLLKLFVLMACLRARRGRGNARTPRRVFFSGWWSEREGTPGRRPA